MKKIFLVAVFLLPLNTFAQDSILVAKNTLPPEQTQNVLKAKPERSSAETQNHKMISVNLDHPQINFSGK